MATENPNIVFIFPDQLRPDFLSCYGAEFIDTPNIDWIANNGVKYSRAYSAAPICVPARTSLLTGMNAIRNGVTDNQHFLRSDYRQIGIETLPEVLGNQGYYTAAVGKMHFYPWDAYYGYQYRVIAEDKRWLEIKDDYANYLKSNNLSKLHGSEHDGYLDNKGAVINRIPWEHSVDRYVGREACKFIDQNGADGPFALMVGFPGPHCPYDPAPDFPDTFDPDNMPNSIPEVPEDTPLMRQAYIEDNKKPWNGVDYSDFTEDNKKKIRAHYAGLVKQIDYEVGEIISTLRKKQLLDNTIIVFATDHGDYLGDHNLIGKASFYESAWHIPLLVRLPGKDGNIFCDQLVEVKDITATLISLVGLNVPAHMDSIPLPDLGIPTSCNRERIFGLLSDGWCVFDGTWKLVKYSNGEILMFNLLDDPQEQKNLINDESYKQIYRHLDEELTQYLMISYNSVVHDRIVDSKTLFADMRFGREGAKRTFPANVDSIT